MIAKGPKINLFQAFCNYFLSGYSGEARILVDS